MEKKYLALIGFVVVITFLGGYFGVFQYKSTSYDDLLKKSDDNLVQARNTLLTSNITNSSYDTNIKIAQSSMSSMDQAINQSEKMVNVAPDNATKQYAQIRLQQLQNGKKLQEYYLKTLEDIKSSGILAAATLLQNNTQDINNIISQIANEQNQLIVLINSNPSLNERLIKVLGKDRVNEILMSSFPGNQSTIKNALQI